MPWWITENRTIYTVEVVMPPGPKRPCNHPGCGALVAAGYCDRHRREARHYDDQRGSASARGYDRRWQKASAAYLRDNPWCEPCARDGVYHLAEVVDHIVPHRGDPVLFWDRDNWQSMAKSCHDTKTAREDGGFGRAPKGGGSNL